MPRPPRDTGAGVFHIYTHCVWAASEHFRDDIDRLEFLRRLAAVVARSPLKCVAFCLMGTHYHLIVDVAQGLLPSAMQSLNHGYVMTFNKRHALRGHAQFGPYGARRIEGETDLLDTFKYVALNPVKANLCTRPEDWAWSSYGGTAGLAKRQPFVDDALVLKCFRWPEVDPQAGIQAYVAKS